MHTAAGMVAAVLALGLVAHAQTESPPQKDQVATESLWKIEVSGISGWGAPSTAARVRAVLEKDKGIRDLVFDTCGTGYFDVRKGYEPKADALTEMLVKNRVKGVRVESLALVQVPKAAAVYELSIAGLGWAETAHETRAVLSKLDGVIRVHPNGLNGKALVFVRDPKAFTEDAADQALRGAKKEMHLRKMVRA